MGGGIGGLLHSLRDGAPKYNLGNGRGDVVAQSDATGALTWTASYEAFGTRPVETGTNADRQRANTKEEDPTGLLWEHFRYRDLETGVWLSRDPAGFVDGPNLYAYVNQNPWSKFDPLGLYTGEFDSTGLSGERPEDVMGPFSAKCAIGGAVALLAAPVIAKIGVAEIAKEVGDELFDAGFERVTGVSAPPTSITDLTQKVLKEGGQKLARETTEVGLETAKDISETAGKKWDVGEHGPLRKSAESGLDSHHVGQDMAMRKFVSDYDRESAPAILVPRKGHTKRIDPDTKCVSRKTTGFSSARDVVARDVREMRRVYPDAPNSQICKLINMNKMKYRDAMEKKRK
jgi:RHS repeat-associated protein